MIISDEQVRLALEYLQSPRVASPGDPGRAADSGVTPELVERVKSALESMPETRGDRVAEARAVLESSGFASHDVAVKMIGRIISDSIR
ncbi:MAG: hypothetical protein WC971_09640 [Coriobacteriia bacterium]